MKTKFQNSATPALSVGSKARRMAVLALLGASIAAPALAQTGGAAASGSAATTTAPAKPGMGPGMGGMGPGAGKGMHFSFDKDNTPGWALMSAEERTAHHDKMRTATTYDECKALQDGHHKAMEVRAKEKGVTLPAPRQNGCDRMKARGFFK